MDTRLIIDEPARGSWNMAIDEALLESAGQGGGPVLRFYRWSEPTLSLGYFQQIANRVQHPTSSLLPVVRRATGGGAIIHDCELTYSFVTAIRDRFSSEIQAFVIQFHESLIETLKHCGVRAGLCGDAMGETKAEPFLCFQRRSSLDILIDGSKVVGSAQRSYHGALLQHGSILLSRSSQAVELPGIQELSKREPSHQQIVGDWSQRLAKQFGFRYRSCAPTPAELASAASIEHRRFANTSWTNKR